MGGYGSGWQGAKKTTVEACRVLDIANLLRQRALVPSSWTSGVWAWTYAGEASPHSSIGYEADLSDPEAAWLRLHYNVNGEPVDYRIGLVTTRPTCGGRRWWFLCPLLRRDDGPPPRAAKLYLPPGCRWFGSRAGYGLTYASCQESGQFRGLFRRLAAEMGTDAAMVRRALGRAAHR